MENQNTLHAKAVTTSTAQPGTVILCQATLNLNTISDQPLILKGGSNFIIVDIILTNAPRQPLLALAAAWYTGKSQSGSLLAATNDGDFPNGTLYELSSPAVFANALQNGNGSSPGISFNTNNYDQTL